MIAEAESKGRSQVNQSKMLGSEPAQYIAAETQMGNSSPLGSSGRMQDDRTLENSSMKVR